MKLLSVLTLLVATAGIQQTMGHPAAGTADITPNTNDPVVKQWLSTLDLSNVPNLGPSNGGKVNYNPTLCGPPTVIAPNQGSWTCQKFVAPDDIVDCPDKLTWGLTYDDGPSEFTPTLLTALAANNVHATFFVVGSRVVSHPDILKNIIGQGHNVAVHTYSHPSLTSLSNDQVVAELKWTLKAIKDTIGLTPKYMRPPFGDTDNRVRAITKAVGLTTVIWTDGFDTDDWSLTTGKSTINDVLNIFNSWVVKAPSMPRGFLVLEHDLFKQTVDAAVVVIGKATKTNLIIKTVPQCIGDNSPYLESVGAADTGSPSNGVALAVHAVIPITSVIIGSLFNFI
ncbi:10102_t:CDS:2 [Paraglomus brasilianum]|uniref:chitin deacetylase n=1 Tax=Paraglomus brasilianum TaxID=144538 RepID=A0A9N9DKU3_9GLOM|nr:10102_t:CDS:2 [Paraglomus brasilianum]